MKQKKSEEQLGTERLHAFQLHLLKEAIYNLTGDWVSTEMAEKVLAGLKADPPAKMAEKL